MVNKKEKTREQYKVAVGPLMKKILDKQRENIKDATFNVCESSYWEASEVIAKKVMEKGLV